MCRCAYRCRRGSHQRRGPARRPDLTMVVAWELLPALRPRDRRTREQGWLSSLLQDHFDARRFYQSQVLEFLTSSRCAGCRVQPLLHLAVINQSGLLQHEPAAMENDKIWDATHVVAGRQTRMFVAVDL